MVTAARNALVDRQRRDRRRSRREAVFETESRQRKHLWMCPDAESNYMQLTDALHKALACTPARRRAAYLMVHEEDMSYSSAGARLEVSPRAVESRVRRTRMELREELAEFRVGARPKRGPTSQGGAESFRFRPCC